MIERFTEVNSTVDKYLAWGVSKGIYDYSKTDGTYWDGMRGQEIPPLIAAAEARSRMYGEIALRLMFPDGVVKQEYFSNRWDISDTLQDGKILRVEVKLREGQYTFSKLVNDTPYIDKSKSEAINSYENSYLLTISSDLVAILHQADASGSTVTYSADATTYVSSQKITKERVLYPVEKATRIKQLQELCL